MRRAVFRPAAAPHPVSPAVRPRRLTTCPHTYWRTTGGLLRLGSAGLLSRTSSPTGFVRLRLGADVDTDVQASQLGTAASDDEGSGRRHPDQATAAQAHRGHLLIRHCDKRHIRPDGRGARRDDSDPRFAPLQPPIPTAPGGDVTWGLRGWPHTPGRSPTTGFHLAAVGRGKGGPQAHPEGTRSALPATRCGRNPRPAVERSRRPRGRLGWDRGSRLLSPHTVRRKSANRPTSTVVGQQHSTMNSQLRGESQ